MDSKIKQEIPEDSFQNSFKIENSNDNLDEIEFKNCDVKEEIINEVEEKDPLSEGIIDFTPNLCENALIF